MCLYPVILKEKDYGIIRDFRKQKQWSVYRIKNTILFLHRFERSNPVIIDSSCGLHVRKIKYAFALLSRRKWSLDDLKQETIHLWRQKEVIFTLLPFHGFAKFFNRQNLKDYKPL